MAVLLVLFQNAISASPKLEVAISMPSSQNMFWKRAPHKYILIYAYIQMCIYMSICIYVYMYIGKDIYIYINVYKCVYINALSYSSWLMGHLNKYTYLYMRKCIYVYINIGRPTYVCIYLSDQHFGVEYPFITWIYFDGSPLSSSCCCDIGFIWISRLTLTFSYFYRWRFILLIKDKSESSCENIGEQLVETKLKPTLLPTQRIVDHIDMV